MKKYELTDEKILIDGQILRRIRALRDFDDVKAGDIGGYIENENNLSHEGNAWVYSNACVYGDARVFGNAYVYGDARVNGNACVFGNAWVYSNACVYGNACVFGNAYVYGDARVNGNACVFGNARVCEKAKIAANEDYTIIQGFGTECRSTTFYRCVDGKVRVKCGCFSGTIDEFRDQVKRTRNGKIAKEYLMIADLMEYHFGAET